MKQRLNPFKMSKYSENLDSDLAAISLGDMYATFAPRIFKYPQTIGFINPHSHSKATRSS